MKVEQGPHHPSCPALHPKAHKKCGCARTIFDMETVYEPPDVYICHPDSRPGKFILGHWRKRRKGEIW